MILQKRTFEQQETIREDKKKSPLFVFLDSISYSKDDPFEMHGFTEADYNAFIINKFLAYQPDTLFYAFEMNLLPNIPFNQHFDYLQKSIRKKKRWFNYPKKNNIKNLETIALYYKCSEKEAKLYIDILKDNEISYMETIISKGGHNEKV